MRENNVEFLNMGENFAELIAKANKIQEKCRDYKVKAKNVAMGDDLKLYFDDGVFPMSELASGHLCGKLQVPSRYFAKLVNAGKNELAAKNINCWLEKNEKELLFREYNGKIRGVLSGSYSAYDAPEILKSLSEVFDMEHFKLKGSFINEERLHLRLIEDQMMNVDGEDLFAGISLDSSDVGRSGLKARFFVWKQVCTNGMVIAKSSANMFKQKHIGITHDEFVNGLKEGLNTFYLLKDEVTEAIKKTKSIPLPEDIEEMSEYIKEQTKLSDDAVEEVIEFINVNYEPNMFGLINGITEVAQHYTLERRIELEEIAGSMLE